MMSADGLCKMKAVLLVGMVGGAEVRQVQENVGSSESFRTKFATSAGSAGGTSPSGVHGTSASRLDLKGNLYIHGNVGHTAAARRANVQSSLDEKADKSSFQSLVAMTALMDATVDNKLDVVVGHALKSSPPALDMDEATHGKPGGLAVRPRTKFGSRPTARNDPHPTFDDRDASIKGETSQKVDALLDRVQEVQRLHKADLDKTSIVHKNYSATPRRLQSTRGGDGDHDVIAKSEDRFEVTPCHSNVSQEKLEGARHEEEERVLAGTLIRGDHDAEFPAPLEDGFEATPCHNNISQGKFEGATPEKENVPIVALMGGDYDGEVLAPLEDGIEAIPCHSKASQEKIESAEPEEEKVPTVMLRGGDHDAALSARLQDSFEASPFRSNASQEKIKGARPEDEKGPTVEDGFEATPCHSNASQENIEGAELEEKKVPTDTLMGGDRYAKFLSRLEEGFTATPRRSISSHERIEGAKRQRKRPTFKLMSLLPFLRQYDLSSRLPSRVASAIQSLAPSRTTSRRNSLSLSLEEAAERFKTRRTSPTLEAASGRSKLANVAQKADASNAAVAFVIAKNFFGSCFMITPKGFQESGILGGPLCLVLVYLMEVRCMLNLIKCRDTTHFEQVVKGESTASGEGYEHLGVALHPLFPSLITTMIMLCQFGFVCIWLVCNTQNLGMVAPDSSITLRLWIQFPILFGLVWVRRLKYFAYTNLIGIAFTCVLIVFFFAYMGDHYARFGPQAVQMINTQNSDLFLWLGACAYAYEGINIVLPTYESAKDKVAMPKLLVGITSFTTLIYIIFGSLTYLTLGDEVASMVSLNLPKGSLPGRAIPMTSVIIGLASIPLQAFVVFQTYEPKLQWSKKQFVRMWQKNAGRSLFLFFSFLVTWLGGDQLQNFLALVGGVCCASLALIIPSILYIVICKPKGLALCLDWGIFLFGIFIMCLSTYEAIVSWK